MRKNDIFFMIVSSLCIDFFKDYLFSLC